jgi:hypothetical protein
MRRVIFCTKSTAVSRAVVTEVIGRLYIAHRQELERCSDYDHENLWEWREGRLRGGEPPCHLLKLRAGD